jgi:hypothetical protein
MFPADDILVARGKYSTLNRERRVQVVRVVKVCETMQRHIYALKARLETRDPTTAPIAEMKRCLESLEDAGNRIVSLCEQLAELHPVAWGQDEVSE